MADYPALQNVRQNLDAKLKQLLAMNVLSNLVKQAGTSTYSFEDGRVYIDRLLKLYVELNRCPKDHFP